MKALIAIALPILISAGAAAAQSGSYSGNWPITVKLPPQFGHTGCLALTDNGTAGSPHSGPVTSSGDLGDLSGTFQVVKDLLVVNLESTSFSGEVVWISYIARAHDGQVGKGFYNNPGFFAAAPLAFGEKGGC